MESCLILTRGYYSLNEAKINKFLDSHKAIKSNKDDKIAS